jgi:hypothetical protein
LTEQTSISMEAHTNNESYLEGNVDWNVEGQTVDSGQNHHSEEPIKAFYKKGNTAGIKWYIDGHTIRVTDS